jgi:hypothetical protein
MDGNIWHLLRNMERCGELHNGSTWANHYWSRRVLSRLSANFCGDLAASRRFTIPTGATVAVVQVDTAPVRWRDDGVAPTARDVGMQMKITDPPFQFDNLASVKFIFDYRRLSGSECELLLDAFSSSWCCPDFRM